MNTLKIVELSKKYGKKYVLNHINLEIKPGVFGLLGPNGAGKTTLMKCIVDIIDYKGSITLEKSNKKNMPKQIGYLPQKFSLFKQLTVREALEYIALLKQVKDKKEIDRLIQSVNLTEQKNKKIKDLSGGMLRRVGIAQALLGNPKVLVVDEPTAGLDPKERVRFRNILGELPKNIIILISSHIVEDLDIVADSIAIMNKGEILAKGDIDLLLSQIDGKVGIKDVHRDEIKSYEKSYNVTSMNHHQDVTTIKIVGDNLPQNTKIITPTLEDLYFYLIGDMDEE